MATVRTGAQPGARAGPAGRRGAALIAAAIVGAETARGERDQGR